MSSSMRLTSVTHKVAIDSTSVPYVSQMMGNGRRDVVPETAEVITYAGQNGKYVYITGPLIKRDGTRGRRRGVGWGIGGRYDESDSAPEIVFEILKHLDGLR